MNLLKREVHNTKNNPQAFIQSVNRKDCMSVWQSAIFVHFPPVLLVGATCNNTTIPSLLAIVKLLLIRFHSWTERTEYIL